MPVFEGSSANEAWLCALDYFRQNGGMYVRNTRSGATKEVLRTQFVVRDPRQRWVVSRHPPMNPAYAVAEIVWIVSGRDDAAFVNAWNSQLPRFAGSGEIYHGAYGYRLRRRFGTDQLVRVYEALRGNPSTRQAVLQIWDASTDLPDATGQPVAEDIPCNVCAMLKVRDGKLEWTQIVRSNDLTLGVPYNFVQFTTMQEILAGWLDVDVGLFCQWSDSLHIYERDLETVLQSEVIEPAHNSDSLALPKQTSDQAFRDLAGGIEYLADRTLSISRISNILRNAELPPSYLNLLRVVAAEAARKRNFMHIATEIIGQCTNPTLVQVWQRWASRFEPKLMPARAHGG